jgi:hypothetical protein
LGDAILQWPAAFWWHRNTGKPFSVWLEEKTCGPLKPLIEFQDGVESVTMRGGIANWSCGGQPWHWNASTDDLNGSEVYHLGMRGFPQRQITLETMEQIPLSLGVSHDDLAKTPVFKVKELPRANRVVIHGSGVCRHNNQTPHLWAFLARIRHELPDLFDEVVFVGSDEDRGVAALAYPGWPGWPDGGDFLELASYVAASELVIACGSSVAALGGALKVPTIRVHDALGNAPKVIWSNLGGNQLNATELELRKEWPEFRERWVTKREAV